MKILTDFQIFISVSLINLSLPVLNNVFMLLCSKEKKLSANIIGTSRFEELALWLVPKKNNNGPSIETRYTPHLRSIH